MKGWARTGYFYVLRELLSVSSGGSAAGEGCDEMSTTGVKPSTGPKKVAGVRVTSKMITIFEGTSEIQRMLIGRTITGLDVR
jgi:hypothetical protein